MVRCIRTPGMAAALVGNDLYGWAWLSVIEEPKLIKPVKQIKVHSGPTLIKFTGGKRVSH